MHDSSFRIVIPTRDGGRWLAAFARGYERLGIRPLYLLDSRTGDDSRAILSGLGCAFVEIAAEQDRGEDVLWRGAAASQADWLLRMDDDELPSVALVDWIRDHGIHRAEPAQYISCRQAWQGGYSRLEGLYFNHSRPDFLMPQPRLFRPREVRFTADLHTAGIVPGDVGWAPAAAFFVHFDWVVRDIAERWSKLVRYEAQRPGGGSEFIHFSIPEYNTAERLRITAFETQEFAPLLAELRTLPHLDLSPAGLS
jgi:hypothetical protein